MSLRDEILAKVITVPSLPASTMDIINQIQNPEADIGRISKTIEYDPALTLNVLRLANSSYFGGPREIGSIQEAIVRMGMKRLFNLVITSSVAPTAIRKVDGYGLRAGELWKHSVAVAICAEQIGLTLGLKFPDYTFTAALLHDIGKIVMDDFVGVDTKAITEKAFEQGISFESAEDMVLGINHAEIGAALLEAWTLPDYIVEAVKYHHHPEQMEESDLVVDLVHMADNLILESGIGSGIDGLNYKPSKEVCERIKLRPMISEEIICKTLIKIEELGDILDPGEGKDK